MALICHCFRVTDSQLRKLAIKHHGSIEAVLDECEAGQGCTGCYEELRSILDDLCTRLKN